MPFVFFFNGNKYHVCVAGYSVLFRSIKNALAPVEL